MANVNFTAGGRYTPGAELLEKFLDDNAMDIPYNIFDSLNDLAGEIETIEENNKTEIEELRAELAAANERIEELEGEE